MEFKRSPRAEELERITLEMQLLVSNGLYRGIAEREIREAYQRLYGHMEKTDEISY